MFFITIRSLFAILAAVTASLAFGVYLLKRNSLETARTNGFSCPIKIDSGKSIGALKFGDPEAYLPLSGEDAKHFFDVTVCDGKIWQASLNPQEVPDCIEIDSRTLYLKGEKKNDLMSFFDLNNASSCFFQPLMHIGLGFSF